MKMKTKTLLSAVILLVVSISVFGQEQTKTTKKINIHDFYIQTGFVSMSVTDGTLADFNKLAPGSELLSNDLTGFYPSDVFPSSGNNTFSVLLGIKLKDKQKTAYRTNPLLRLGISYFSGTSLKKEIYKEYNEPYDTLTSSQAGQSYYIDSVTRQNYIMSYYSKQLRLDASLIFRTNQSARWSLYAGIGATAGVSFNANTEIRYNENYKTETSLPGGGSYSTYGYSGMDKNKIEIYSNKNNLSASIYIPMGIDFRLGKKNEFLKHTHLFYEFRPGIVFISIPELRTVTYGGIQNGFGLRVTWE
jgi:hypothetical protein